MNFVSRSLLSIKKRKNRSFILFMAVLLICNVMAGAISVKNALLNTEKSFADLIPIEVSIEEDYLYFLEDKDNSLTEEIIKKIGSSSYVKKYYFYYKYWLGSNKLENGGGNKLENGKEESIIRADENNENRPFNSFDILGAYKKTVNEQDDGSIKIISGKTFTDDDIKNGNNVILISEQVANKNKLNVGDKIKLGSQIDIYSADVTVVEDEYEIIGIFETKKEYEKDNEGKTVEVESEYIDTIYMPNEAIKNIHNKVTDEIKKQNVDTFDTFSVITKYELNSIEDVEEFKSENLSNLPKGYVFKDNSESISSITVPMNNMKDLSNIIVYASIIASVIIIGLIMVLFCKERKKEMGIYLALGEKKINIAMQLLLETLLVSIVAITISVFTGNIIAKNVSNKMLKNQITEQSTKIENQNNYNSYDLIDSEIITDNYTVSLDVKTILMIYTVAIISISLSTTLPIYYTLKLNPRKILM